MAARARTLPSVISSLLARGLRAGADLALRAADAIDPPSSGVTSSLARLTVRPSWLP
jgi:hypothetical protein